ncbi:MAG: hypothetical protein IPM29_09515 [Planctomycetes bacterium]|nr:hypothetical protein [Planctomycetota bacterium]
MSIWTLLRNGGLLTRLQRIEERLEALERGVASIAREAELRAEIERLRTELDALAQQSFHVIEELGSARGRGRELEARGKAET